jgi:hypothetical protein
MSPREPDREGAIGPKALITVSKRRLEPLRQSFQCAACVRCAGRRARSRSGWTRSLCEHLVVPPKTVDHHVSAISSQLGVKTRTEAAARANRLGIIEK